MPSCRASCPNRASQADQMKLLSTLPEIVVLLDLRLLGNLYTTGQDKKHGRRCSDSIAHRIPALPPAQPYFPFSETWCVPRSPWPLEGFGTWGGENRLWQPEWIREEHLSWMLNCPTWIFTEQENRRGLCYHHVYGTCIWIFQSASKHLQREKNWRCPTQYQCHWGTGRRPMILRPIFQLNERGVVGCLQYHLIHLAWHKDALFP